MKQKNEKEWFLGMLLGTLRASLRGNLLRDKGVIGKSQGRGTIRVGEGTIRLGKNF